jgi:hypothetical protein
MMESAKRIQLQAENSPNSLQQVVLLVVHHHHHVNHVLQMLFLVYSWAEDESASGLQK